MPDRSSAALPFGVRRSVLDHSGAAILTPGIVGLAGAAPTAYAAINIVREIRARPQAGRSSRSSR
jgi:hypothetical protein